NVSTTFVGRTSASPTSAILSDAISRSRYRRSSCGSKYPGVSVRKRRECSRIDRGPNREPGMNGDPSSVGAPTTATSASSSPTSATIRDRRNDGIPKNGKSRRPRPPSGTGMLPSDGGASAGAHMAGSYIPVTAREDRAVRIDAGGRFRVVDVEGGQVVDLFAFSARDVEEYASAAHTRVAIDRLFPRPGQMFWTNHRRPILRFEQDRSPGVHDMLCAACDPSRSAALGVEGWHASCQENLQLAMGGLGFGPVHTPQPINL